MGPIVRVNYSIKTSNGVFLASSRILSISGYEKKSLLELSDILCQFRTKYYGTHKTAKDIELLL